MDKHICMTMDFSQKDLCERCAEGERCGIRDRRPLEVPGQFIVKYGCEHFRAKPTVTENNPLCGQCRLCRHWNIMLNGKHMFCSSPKRAEAGPSDNRELLHGCLAFEPKAAPSICANCAGMCVGTYAYREKHDGQWGWGCARFCPRDEDIPESGTIKATDCETGDTKDISVDSGGKASIEPKHVPKPRLSQTGGICRYCANWDGFKWFHDGNGCTGDSKGRMAKSIIGRNTVEDCPDFRTKHVSKPGIGQDNPDRPAFDALQHRMHEVILDAERKGFIEAAADEHLGLSGTIKVTDCETGDTEDISVGNGGKASTMSMDDFRRLLSFCDDCMRNEGTSCTLGLRPNVGNTGGVRWMDCPERRLVQFRGSRAVAKDIDGIKRRLAELEARLDRESDDRRWGQLEVESKYNWIRDQLREEGEDIDNIKKRLAVAKDIDGIKRRLARLEAWLNQELDSRQQNQLRTEGEDDGRKEK